MIDAWLYDAERACFRVPNLPTNSSIAKWLGGGAEPTEDMIVNGFESEPDESFSDAESGKHTKP
jgi:hypothetical protein